MRRMTSGRASSPTYLYGLFVCPCRFFNTPSTICDVQSCTFLAWYNWSCRTGLTACETQKRGISNKCEICGFAPFATKRLASIDDVSD